MRVAGTERFAKHVPYADNFEHRPAGAAGNQPRTFGCRLQQYFARAVMSKHLMRDGVSLQGNENHIFFGALYRLFYGDRGFSRFAFSDADFSVAVADDNESS